MPQPERAPSVYANAARAFDVVARDYDATYGAPGGGLAGDHGNAVMAWMRQENVALLREAFPPGSYLLELGCGTGEEAVILAREGRRVLATDLSPRMAARALAKARTAGVSGRVRVVTVPAGGIAALRPPHPVDGAYASFGGLNCEPNLPAVARELARLVRPGGLFVTSVMGRTCLFEMVWYALHAQPRRALRRVPRAWTSAPVAGRAGVEMTVPTRYLSVRDVKRAFAPYFVLEQALALPLLLPPPYADVFFRRYLTLFRRLMPVERHLRGKWPWRGLGDHIVLFLRRAIKF